MDRLPPTEVLRSELHDDGRWHIRYPTATQTLCGRPVLEKPAIGPPWPPSCGRCSKIAREWDRIDGSMPAAWRWAA